jgi:hypothetical protein
MAHWKATNGNTNWIAVDENGPNATAGLDMLLYEGEWGYVHDELEGDPLVFMIRANAEENSKSVTYGKWEGTTDGANRAPVSYAIYRLTEGTPEAAWTELSNSITELLYTDHNWSTLPDGNYQYAVKAVYSGNIMSDAELTNVVVRNETKINEKQFSDVLVYSHLNTIYINNVTNVSIKSVEITDIIGRTLHQSAVNNIKTVIPFQAPNGIYFVRLISQNGKSHTTKVTVNY